MFGVRDYVLPIGVSVCGCRIVRVCVPSLAFTRNLKPGLHREFTHLVEAEWARAKPG